MLRLLLVIAVVLAATACGSSTHHAALDAQLDRAIPGAPNTPRWLRIRIWRAAKGLGDPTPTHIDVQLRVRQGSRLVDQIWMRGNFVCNLCSYPDGAKPPRGRLAGLTIVDSTRRSLNFSLIP